METANSEITALPGCYLLVILGEPLCENHKEKILQRVAKGLLSWNTEETQCDLKHLEQVCDNLKTSQKSSAKTELLLQHSTDKLAVEVLFNPQIFTLKQCLRNLLLSPTGHKHVIHAGYSFTGSGSWILKDGIFRFHDFVDELSDPGVTKVLSLYPPGCSLKMHLHCSPTGDWVTNNLENQAFSHFIHLSLNPSDSPNGVPGASSLLEFIEGSLETLEGEEKLEPSPLIGNIRFERPTMYIFPSGQGDCSLFGVTGFTMLIDGGFTRSPCFWKFVRHIERLDSIMLTRINESNLWGILSLLRGKQESSLYLKIGYVFCNIVDKSINSSEEGVNGENGGVASIQSNPNDLTISIIEVGNEIASRLKRIGCNPHQCLRDPIPTQLTLYHKVGHGTLEMFILSPPRDSRLLKDFLAHWSSNKDSLPVVRTRSACKSGGQSGQDIAIPISDVMSICCLLIWKPSNPDDRITRILFPGSAPQSQIMEGLASLKELDLLQKRVCTESSLKQSKSKSTVKSTVRISETSSSTATQKVSTRYRSVSPSMRKTRVAYAKQSSTELGDKGGDSSESQSSPVRRKLISSSNQQTETSRTTRVSTRESVKKTAGEEKKPIKNVIEKKTKTRTSSTTRSATNKATSKSTSEATSEANETVKARPITSKQVRARVNSRRVSDKTTSENDNETKKESQSCTTTAENGDSDFSDKKRETIEVCSEDDHRDSGKGSEDASPKKLPFLDHLRDEVEPDSLESYEIYGNVEISKDSLEHSEDEVVTGDSRSTSQLDHMISREDDDEDMKSRSSPIQEDSNLQSAMISSLSSNISEMTVVSGDKNDDSASDLEVASLTSRINNQMSRSIEISHVEGSRRKSNDSNGSFRTLEAEIKAACEEEDRQSIGSSSRKSSLLSDKRRDSIVKENIFASETVSHENQEKSSVSERRRSSIISDDDDYRRASISKEEFNSERKLSRSNEYQTEQEIEDSKLDTKTGIEVSTVETVPNKEQGFESSKADSISLEFKEESIEKLTKKEMQIKKKKDSSGSLEDELPKGFNEEGESLRKDSIRLSIDKTVEEKKIEESRIKSENETSGQNDIEPIIPENKDNVNEAEVISKETDIDTKEILSTEKEKLLLDSSKSFDVSSDLLSQSQSETSFESTKQTVEQIKTVLQSADQSLTHDSDEREKKESVEDSQQSVIASSELILQSEQKKQEEERLTLTPEETSRKVSIPSESKTQSKVSDENAGAHQEESNLKDESVSSTAVSSQSKTATSVDSDSKISGEISSSIKTENKDPEDKFNINDGDDVKKDSFTSRKESMKISETLKSNKPDFDGTKSESRKSSIASSLTKQVTSDKMIGAKEVDLKRESVSDVFENESKIGLDEAITTELSPNQVDLAKSVPLDRDGSSKFDESRKQSLSSESMNSNALQSSQIDSKESATYEDSLTSSKTTRKDSIQFDFTASKSGSIATEVEFKTITSMESDTKIAEDTSSSSQINRKDSIQSDKGRSSLSSDSRKLTETEIQYKAITSVENDVLDSESRKDTKNIQIGLAKTMESESSFHQMDRKGSVQLKDVTSESTTHGDTSSSQIIRKDSVQLPNIQINRKESVQLKDAKSESQTYEDSSFSSQTTRKDSVQSDFNINLTDDSRSSTETEIQYTTISSMESDSKVSESTSLSSQITRKDSIQSEKERSSISGDSRRLTETEIQFKTSVESTTGISGDESSSSLYGGRKESVQFDKERSSIDISDDDRKQSLNSETIKSIDSEENRRSEFTSQKEDNVFTDSVPASPLTKQMKSDENVQSTVKQEGVSIEVSKFTENIESKNTQQSNTLYEKVPFETENLQFKILESTFSDDKKTDDQNVQDISGEQTKVTKSESGNELDNTNAINSGMKSYDETEHNRITEHRRKPSIDLTSGKSSTITITDSTELNAINTAAIIDNRSNLNSVDFQSFSMQDADKATLNLKSSQVEVKQSQASEEMLTISKDDSISLNKTSIEITSITSTNAAEINTDSFISNKIESSSSEVQPESAELYSKSIQESLEKSMVTSTESEKTESKSSESVKSSQAETKPSEVNTNFEEQIGKSEELDSHSKLRKESLKENVEAQKTSSQSSDASCESNENEMIREEVLSKSSVDIKAQQNSETQENVKEADSKRSSIDAEIHKTDCSITSGFLERRSSHENELKETLLAKSQTTQKSEPKVEESKSNEPISIISSEIEKASLLKSQEISTSEKLSSSIIQQTNDNFGSQEQAESSIQKTSFGLESSLLELNDQRASFTMDLTSTEDRSSKDVSSSVDEKSRKSTSEDEILNVFVDKKDSKTLTSTLKTEVHDSSNQSQFISGKPTQSSESEKIVVGSKDNILESSKTDSVSETQQQTKEGKRGSVSKTSDERKSSLSTDSSTKREIFTTSGSDGSLSYPVGDSIVTESESAKKSSTKQETRLEESTKISKEVKDISSQSADARAQFEERKQSIVSSPKEFGTVESTITETVVSPDVLDSKPFSSSMQTVSISKDVTSSGITKLYLGQASGFDSCEYSGSYEAEEWMQSPKNINSNNDLVSNALKEVSDYSAADLEVASLTSKIEASSNSLTTDVERKETVEQSDSLNEYVSTISAQNDATRQLSSENYSRDSQEQYSVKDSGDDIKQESLTSRKESIKTSEKFRPNEPASGGTKPESRKNSLASEETKQQTTSISTEDDYSNNDGDSKGFQHSFASQDTAMKSSSHIVSSDEKETKFKRESVSDVLDSESRKDTKNIRIGLDKNMESESTFHQMDRKGSVQLKDVTSESTTHGNKSSSQIIRKDSVQSDLDGIKSIDSRRATENEIQFENFTSIESAAETTSSSIQGEMKESVLLDKNRSSISDDHRKQSLSSESIESVEIPLNQSPTDECQQESVQLKDSMQIERKDSNISNTGSSRKSTETEIQYKTISSIESDSKVSEGASLSSQIIRKDSIQSEKEKDIEISEDSLSSSQITDKRSSMSEDCRRATETEIQYKTVAAVESATGISENTSSTIQVARKELIQLDKNASSSSEVYREESPKLPATYSIESSFHQMDRKGSVQLKDVTSESTTHGDTSSSQIIRKDSVQLPNIQINRKESVQLKDAKSESQTYEDSSFSSQTTRKDSVQSDFNINLTDDSRSSTETEIQYTTISSMESDSKVSESTSLSSQITRKDSIQSEKERSSISGDSRRLTETEIQFKTSVESTTGISGDESSSSLYGGRKESVQFDKERSSIDISDDDRKQSLNSETIKSIDSEENRRSEFTSQKEDNVFTDSVPASPLTKQMKSDENVQSTVKQEGVSIEVSKFTENIESKNTQQSNTLYEKVPFETENLQFKILESTFSDDKKTDDQNVQDISGEQTKVTKSESTRKYSQSGFDKELDNTSAIKFNDETENNRITEHRRKPSFDLTGKLSTVTTADTSSTESKTTITTEHINFGANLIGSSYHDSEARTSFIESNVPDEETVLKPSESEICDSVEKSMTVDESTSLDSIETTDSIKQLTSDTSKSTTSGNTRLQSDGSFAQRTSELKRESCSKIEANNQLYSTLTESFDDIQVNLQSTKNSNLTSSNFSDAKGLNKSESLSSENATHSTKFDTVMSIDEETYFYLEDSDSLAQDGHSMASISEKRVTKESENDKTTLSETSVLLSSNQKHEDFASSASGTKQQLFKLSEFSPSSDKTEQPTETSQKPQIEMKDERQEKLPDSSYQYETRADSDGNKISSNLVTGSVQEKIIMKSSNESGSNVMIEERSCIDYRPISSFSESSFDSSSASSRISQTNANSENLMSLKEEMDKSISSSAESQLKTSDEASSERPLSEVSVSEMTPSLTPEGFLPLPTFKIAKNAFPYRSKHSIEGELNQDLHHIVQYKEGVEIEERMQSPTLSNQSSAKLASPTLSPLPGQSFDKLSRDIVDKGVSLRSMAGAELASSIVHLETSANKVTTNLNLPEVISEEAGRGGEESPDLSSPKQSTNDFIAKVETAPGAGTLASTFPTAVEMPSVHLRRSAQMAGQVLYEVPDEEDNIDSPASEKKQVGLARGTTSSKEFPEVLHISEETTPSTPSETQSPRDVKSLTQTTTATTTSMDITSPQDSKSGLCCFPRSIEMDGAKKGKEEKVTSVSTSETTTRVVTHSQNLTEEQKKEKEATLKEWGKPLGLPKPPDANDSKGARSASKSRATSSDRTGTSRSYSSRRSGSSSDQGKPIYLDLAYIPHHGDRHYCNADYFKRIRARYYVLSSVNPSKEVLDALIEGKKCWEDSTAEVTLIPSHETEALCLWMATNQQTLEDLKIDVAPSASRCSVILQDQESSCSAYRVEF